MHQRGARRRQRAADRQGRELRRAPRQRRRADRRVGLGQDHHRALGARLLQARSQVRGRRGAGARPGPHRALQRGSARPARRTGRLPRPERGRDVQSVAAHQRAGHRGAGPPRSHDPGRGRCAGARALPHAGAAGAGADRQPLPAPGLRRPAPAPDGGDGAVQQPGPHGARRADHRARRHHPDRGAEVVQEGHSRAGRGGDVRDPRPGGRRPDRRLHRRALSRRGPGEGSGRGDPRQSAASLHPAPDGGGPARAGSGPRRRRYRRPCPRRGRAAGQGRECRLREDSERPGAVPDPRAHQRRHRTRPHRRHHRRVGLREVDAGPGHGRPASTRPRRRPPRRERRSRVVPRAHRRRAAQGAVRLPDGGYRAQPEAPGRRDPRPAAGDEPRAEGPGEGGADRGAAGDGGPASRSSRCAFPTSSPAARSSGSTLPARSRRSRR